MKLRIENKRSIQKEINGTRMDENVPDLKAANTSKQLDILEIERVTAVWSLAVRVTEMFWMQS
jgi:hypothetical protein